MPSRLQSFELVPPRRFAFLSTTSSPPYGDEQLAHLPPHYSRKTICGDYSEYSLNRRSPATDVLEQVYLRGGRCGFVGV